MKLGDVVTNAIWVTGDESVGLRKRYEQDVTESIDTLCQGMGFIHGLVTFIEKHPESEDVPPVPDHIQGQRVRLLVAESTVVKKALEVIQESFVANLDKKDLAKLRSITRKAYAKH
ncbi:hypothetical protein LCGC14_3069700, partial [marine sediment metagenome]